MNDKSMKFKEESNTNATTLASLPPELIQGILVFLDDNLLYNTKILSKKRYGNSIEINYFQFTENNLFRLNKVCKSLQNATELMFKNAYQAYLLSQKNSINSIPISDELVSIHMRHSVMIKAALYNQLTLVEGTKELKSDIINKITSPFPEYAGFEFFIGSVFLFLGMVMLLPAVAVMGYLIHQLCIGSMALGSFIMMMICCPFPLLALMGCIITGIALCHYIACAYASVLQCHNFICEVNAYYNLPAPSQIPANHSYRIEQLLSNEQLMLSLNTDSDQIDSEEDSGSINKRALQRFEFFSTAYTKISSCNDSENCQPMAVGCNKPLSVSFGTL